MKELFERFNASVERTKASQERTMKMFDERARMLYEMTAPKEMQLHDDISKEKERLFSNIEHLRKFFPSCP